MAEASRSMAAKRRLALAGWAAGTPGAMLPVLVPCSIPRVMGVSRRGACRPAYIVALGPAGGVSNLWGQAARRGAGAGRVEYFRTVFVQTPRCRAISRTE